MGRISSVRTRCAQVLLAAASAAVAGTATAQQFDTEIPMQDRGVSTFYVQGHVEGSGTAPFMVDTGSGYTTINEHTLDALKVSGNAQFVKNLTGVMADGSRTILPVYLIASIDIGGHCMVRNFEAAVFPGEARQILGLSTLRKVSPFIFSLDPPRLTLSNCSSVRAQTDLTGDGRGGRNSL